MANAPSVQPSKPEEIEFPSARHVAFMGDWHGNLHFAKRAIAELPEHVDVVVHTGDFGYMFEGGYLNAVNKSARQRDLVVMFVDGNHENHEWLNSQPVDDDGVRRLRPRVWHLPRGFRWEWCGLKFLALGGAHSVDRKGRKAGVSWWAEEVISHSDMQRSIDGGKADVMVCHDAPDGHFIPGLMPAGSFPREDLELADRHREAVGFVAREVEARYLWHGHYHSKYRASNGEITVTGLDCDSLDPGSVGRNVDIVDLMEL